jgi:hypothetical protein
MSVGCKQLRISLSRFHRFPRTNRSSGMVDDADFEFAIWAGGGNAVFLDECRNHVPLDKIFLGIDMADERLAVTVLRRPFDGASKPAI